MSGFLFDRGEWPLSKMVEERKNWYFLFAGKKEEVMLRFEMGGVRFSEAGSLWEKKEVLFRLINPTMFFTSLTISCSYYPSEFISCSNDI